MVVIHAAGLIAHQWEHRFRAGCPTTNKSAPAGAKPVWMHRPNNALLDYLAAPVKRTTRRVERRVLEGIVGKFCGPQRPERGYFKSRLRVDHSINRFSKVLVDGGRSCVPRVMSEAVSDFARADIPRSP
jgi:hypothetical protein